jgi:hypothetical protein
LPLLLHCFSLLFLFFCHLSFHGYFSSFALVLSPFLICRHLP